MAKHGGSLYINEDNTLIFTDKMKEQIKLAAKKIGLTAEGYAKEACPVDTGRLKGSITHRVVDDNGDISVYIGTNVKYGRFVEMGTKKREGVFFLRRAATEHGSEYREILNDELQS